MSGRVMASVPDSPQQRSFLLIVAVRALFISVFTTVSGSCFFIGEWQGS